jgi:hypothetical protein
MQLLLNSVETFIIVIALFGFLGFLQGWQRMIVVMGFTLGALLFLYIGLANVIAQFFFVRIPLVISDLTGGAIGDKTTPPPPSANQVLISAIITLIIAIILGFLLSGRAFPPIKVGNITFTAHTRDRFVGIIPGMITGYAVTAYIGHIFASNPSISVGLSTPNTNNLGNTILILFIIALVALIIGVLTARFGK